MAKCSLVGELRVDHIPCPPEHAAAYWEGLRLAWKLMTELALEELQHGMDPDRDCVPGERPDSPG